MRCFIGTIPVNMSSKKGNAADSIALISMAIAIDKGVLLYT